MNVTGLSGRIKLSDEGRGTYFRIKWAENIGDGGWVVGVIENESGYVSKNHLYKVHWSKSNRPFINIGKIRYYLE